MPCDFDPFLFSWWDRVVVATAATLHWLIITASGVEKERIISEMLMRQPAVLALLQLWTALLFLPSVGKMGGSMAMGVPKIDTS